MPKPTIPSQEYISTRKQAIEKMKGISNSDQEICAIVTISPDFRVIRDHIISLGGFHTNYVPLGVLFERVLADKARFFLMGHNHPNGVGNPSEADLITTLKILYACEFLDVGFMDSIIFPYGKEPNCLRASYPKIFKTVLTDKVDKTFKTLIPRKVREDAK